MTKEVLYKYLGTNGVIESYVHLEDIYYIRVNILKADEGMVLTNGVEEKKIVRCSDDELGLWTEVKSK